MSRRGNKSLIKIAYLTHGYENSVDQIESDLLTDRDLGITNTEAKRRLLEIGNNVIITPKPSLWKLYLAPLFDTLITIYLIMTLIMIILAFWVDDIFSKISFWIVMIMFNMILAIFQQFRAQKKLNALQSLSPPQATVIRDGEIKEIPASELVPGDVISLHTGDKIPADSRLIDTSNMTVNEASLTGESVPVDKNTNGGKGINKDAPISQHKNFVYLGTYIQTGTGKAIVIRTGNDTELGKISQALGDMNTLDIPLRKKVNTLGKKLSILMVAFLCAKMTQVIIQDMNGSGSVDNLAFDLADAIITAMSVIPINIPLLTTLTLLSGVLAMAQNRVVVKNLAIIETLGRCSVLCSDKTGTMTTSNMTVKLLWDTVNFYGVELDDDYGNKISFVPKSEVDEFLDLNTSNYPAFDFIKSGSPLELLLTSAVLNNDAQLLQRKTSEDIVRYEIIGNHTDGALLALALAQGFNEDEIKSRYIIEKEFPFDSTYKRMTGLFRDNEEGDWMILSKGATEVILPRSTSIGDETNITDLSIQKAEEIQNKVDFFARNGYRVISLAYKSISHIPSLENLEQEREFLESGLTYIGFAVIFDPPRPGVKNAVAELDSAGVFPIMITGDSKSTAATIGRQVGILDPNELVIEGSKAATLTDEEFFKVSVFARVAPKDKEVIVRRYQNRGDVVAMTGDGVNDSLAISRADAGVSMGITGTEVTKEAADIIITDDSYISLVRGVEEGRNLYNRIRIMIFFYIFINFAEALLYFTATFIPDFVLITQWQRIYIFTIIHAFPVLAIIFGPSDEKVMQLKPRNNDALIPKQLFYAGLWFTFTYVIILVFAYFLAYDGIISVNDVNRSGNWEIISNLSRLEDQPSIEQAKARTILISVMYFVESFIILSIRRFNQGIMDATRKDSNLLVWILVLTGPIFHLLVMFVIPLQRLLIENGFYVNLILLSVSDWIIVIILASIPIVILELFKANRRHNNIQF